MKIDVKADFPLSAPWSDYNSAEAVYEFDGKRHYLRRLDEHILYRVADPSGVEQTFYITEPPPAVGLDHTVAGGEAERTFAADYEAWFTGQTQAGHSGRLALYACPHARDCVAALYFAPDGTGRFLDYYLRESSPKQIGLRQVVDFVWEGSKHGIGDYADILTTNWETLLPLCEEVFTRQIWPRMADPYVSYADLPDEPVRFVCGSQEELEHITRCICHIDEGWFAEVKANNPVIVQYKARTAHQPGGLDEMHYNHHYPQRRVGSNHLCQLAFTYNTFYGGIREYDARNGLLRDGCYQLKPISASVQIAPPSSHEQAESLLALYEWLEGKVSDADRRRLLRLDASPADRERTYSTLAWTYHSDWYFPLPGFWKDKEVAEAKYKFDGQEYTLRQFDSLRPLDRYILYRTKDRLTPEHTLWVASSAALAGTGRSYQENGMTCLPAVYPEDAFREQVRAGQTGRLALYECPYARDCVAALFFASDGTGRFLDYYTADTYGAHDAGQTIDFQWDGAKYGIRAFADILTCKWKMLMRLCEEVFLRQVWPRMTNPYVGYGEMPDEPFSFVCGSQKALEDITRCICHVDMTDKKNAYATYLARTSTTREDVRSNSDGSVLSLAKSLRLRRLALAHNTFQGGTWKYSAFRDNTRRSAYKLMPEKIQVAVTPPTASERDRARHKLYVWLDGKVSDMERRHLLSLNTGSV